MNDEYVNVVGITFKKYGKKYYFDCHNLNLRKNLTVIVETERGLQFGTVITDIIKIDGIGDIMAESVAEYCRLFRPKRSVETRNSYANYNCSGIYV